MSVPTTADGKTPIDEDTDYPVPLVSLAFPGVRALMWLPSTMIAESEKCVTRRGIVNGDDLVWKTVDFHRAPEYSGYSYEELVRMMENEVRAYLHLDAVQGTLVPRFLFRGSDINFFWVFVTSYEGESFETLAANGLTADMKAKALASLAALHERGVIHGDAEIRNVLWRAADNKALWIDFEFASIETEFKSRDAFERAAEKEMREFQKALENVPTRSG